MPEPRARLVVGARAATGAVALVLGAGLIAAATFLPLPSARLEPQSVTVTPVPAADELVCPGAVLRLGDESGANATDASAIGSSTSVRASTTGEVESRALGATDAGGGLGAPTVLTVPSAPDAGIAGAQSQSVETADYRGFAAAECGAPSSDAWIVGGSTAVGRTTLLTIANPGAVPTTASVEIYGENGIIDAPGTTGIIVAAGSQRVLSLAGFAPSLDLLAVHVTTRGGPVVANLQQSVVRGIDPGGVEIVGATAAPATSQVIPGLTIRNAVETQGLLGIDGFADLESVLRVFVPGENDAATTVSITAAADGAAAASFELVLPAGVVTEVPLDDLVDGRYSVDVESDVPVVAALRGSTVAGEAADLAWFTAAEPLTGDTLIPVAAGPGSTLSVSNTTDEAIVATLDEQTVEVPAGGSVGIPVDDARTYRLAGGAGLAVSVGYSAAGRLAAYTVSASATEEPPVVVYP